ncbi:type I DNA topoisomerase [Ponticaulis sp.]|uniref:type I DNA topoisomerase n=1 Tax=Ponticaulis sp. TaxID=2020902 RepID=UPI000B72FE03|nr:type I DNA topoisomerase [Ponticaulis sp.]MAI89626.1 DNA topoisomerase I [Ponticaulis sp.]OUY00651.1 MAG: DNA topoisomerase I [Hyphomonadaceae bacterium TMED5]|tara:strand:- start:164803 stop:167364 length:2562 start_codon:yes stop_codon:yes gene_type:complete
MKVVVVESPAKAKTINKYLGKDYKVLASYGHIRDLPSKDGSVRPDEDFAMSWEADAKSTKRIREIAEAVKGSDQLILATDPDREGEAISWHLLEALKNRRVLKDVGISRVVFNAITKTSVTEAMKNPRDIDQELVDAYLARRALDYLVGFSLSPVLWRKLPGSRSAGRVQSVALRLICEREREIEIFKPEEYWQVAADLKASDGSTFEARLVELNGEKLKKFSLGNKDDADKALEAVRRNGFTVDAVEAKPVKRNPPPPFITSTLQQDASRRLGFGAKRTMQAAQKLYEDGKITYMRTDGVQMAEEAYQASRDVIRSNYGGKYLPEKARRYSSKAKNAQEAHEAIRPTDFTLHPNEFRGDADLAKLYGLIWRRAVASQMEAARFERTTVDITSADKAAGLRATGSVLMFDGFLTLYQEGQDEPDGDEDNSRLPKLEQGENPELVEAKSSQHFTEPPPRFSEASLVKRLEELGIGRPSTYASILSVLQDREYVRLDKKRFIPEDKGRLVTGFLESFFERYVQYDFTADLEEKLDLVSDGQLKWKDFLAGFWKDFHAAIGEISDLRVSEVLDALNEVLGPYVFRPAEGADPNANPRACPNCNDGQLSLKLGRHGAFVGCSNYPECKFTRAFSVDAEESQNQINPDGNVLGTDPETGKEVSLKTGRFGPYVELEPDEGEKPKRGSIPKGWKPEELTLDKAIQLLSLPREVGVHPEDGEPILANIGRYGPYVQHQKTYANLPSVEEVFDIGLNRAVSVIADKRANPGRRGSAPKVLKEIGAHPVDGEAIQVLEGRYGPYVKHGKTNATLPKDSKPEEVTLEQAVELIAAKAKSPPKKKKAPATKKPAAKKTTKAKSE